MLRIRSMNLFSCSFCVIVVLLTWMMVTSALADQNSDNRDSGITDDLAAGVFGFAWPTATYNTWSLEGININGDERDVTFRLYGTGTNDDGGNFVWTDVTIQFADNRLSNVAFGDNNGLVRPGATMEALGQVVVALNNEYQQSQRQSLSAPDDGTTPGAQNTANAPPMATSPPGSKTQALQPAEPTIDDLGNQTWQFLTTYWAASDSVQSQDVPSALGGYYSDPLMYYGKETDLASVLRGKAAYTARWPTRQTTILPNTVSISCGEGPPPTCTVTGNADYSASNEERLAQASGVESFVLVVMLQNGHDVITEESSRVIQQNQGDKYPGIST